ARADPFTRTASHRSASAWLRNDDHGYRRRGGSGGSVSRVVAVAAGAVTLNGSVNHEERRARRDTKHLQERCFVDFVRLPASIKREQPKRVSPSRGPAPATDPFRELRSLMRAHTVAGNRAEALRVYAKCRQLFETSSGRSRPPKPPSSSVSYARSSEEAF